MPGILKMMTKNWPFSDPSNLGVIISAKIVREGHSILYVTHDLQDGGWQFLTGERVASDEGLVVKLEVVAQLDPSIVELADLPLGWCAWRSNSGGPWSRAANTAQLTFFKSSWQRHYRRQYPGKIIKNFAPNIRFVFERAYISKPREVNSVQNENRGAPLFTGKLIQKVVSKFRELRA